MAKKCFKVGGFHVHEDGVPWSEVGVIATYHDLDVKHVQALMGLFSDPAVAAAYKNFAEVLSGKLYELGETYAVLKGKMTAEDVAEVKKMKSK